MPTAAKLAAAVMLAIWGWYVATLASPLFFGAMPPPGFRPAAILIGIYLGWAYLGRRAGLGYVAAIGNGVTAGFVFGFLCLLVVSFSIMIQRAIRQQYDGPMEGAIAVFGIMVAESPRFLDTTLIVTILLGAVICGVITEFIDKRCP
ncbi:MAG: TrgA family protein [Loktanella sp.]|nr:TrgA family protein [Loktanella sp.]